MSDLILVLAARMRPLLSIARTTLVVTLCLPPSLTSAQDSVALPIGSRVRISITEAGVPNQLTGDLLALNRDSILFSPGRQALSIDRVIRLEVSDGRQRHPFAGLFIGAAIGAIVGGTTAAITASHQRDGNPYVRQEYTPSVMAVYGGVLGVGVGAPVGLVIGSFKIYERWISVRVR